LSAKFLWSLVPDHVGNRRLDPVEASHVIVCSCSPRDLLLLSRPSYILTESRFDRMTVSDLLDCVFSDLLCIFVSVPFSLLAVVVVLLFLPVSCCLVSLFPWL